MGRALTKAGQAGIITLRKEFILELLAVMTERYHVVVVPKNDLYRGPEEGRWYLKHKNIDFSSEKGEVIPCNKTPFYEANFNRTITPYSNMTIKHEARRAFAEMENVFIRCFAHTTEKYNRVYIIELPDVEVYKDGRDKEIDCTLLFAILGVGSVRDLIVRRDK